MHAESPLVHFPPSDIPILRALLAWGDENFPRGNLNVSAQQIAITSGLHRNTVQRRIAALQDGGVVEGYLFEPHPHAVGLVRTGHLFDGVDLLDVEQLAERIAPFPWVSIAALHLQSCFLHTWHDDPQSIEKEIKAVQDTLGADSVYRSFRSDHWPPTAASGHTLTPLDRRIIIALRRSRRRSVAQIAQEVGTTRRTAARHIDRLVTIGAGAMLPIFRPGRIEGKVIALFETPHRFPGAIETLKQTFPDRIMGPIDTGRIMVMVPFSSLDEATRLQRHLQETAGLKDLELRFMRDTWFPTSCDEWLRERVQNAPLAGHND